MCVGGSSAEGRRVAISALRTIMVSGFVAAVWDLLVASWSGRPCCVWSLP